MYRHGQWPIEDSALVKALLCKMEFTVRALYGEGAEDENEKKTKTKKNAKKKYANLKPGAQRFFSVVLRQQRKTC